jgi:thiamine biosynthesis lipoprotein
MGTTVTIEVLSPRAASAIDRAFEWFTAIEATCTRFDAESELMRLTTQAGVAVPASPMLFEAVRFALRVAEETGGAFDPTIGHRMEARGFDREHRTGAVIHTAAADDVSYRDVILDPAGRTITVRRPLVLDLGAVAKGMAVDVAARELQPFEDFAIDAGGDLYLGGRNASGAPWSIGIRHPRADGGILDSVHVSGAAICTSGDYERRAPSREGHHILDARTGTPAAGVASATVVAPSAMLADALATAAFVLGPEDGLALLVGHDVDGLIVTTDMGRHQTPGWACLTGRRDA